MLELSSNTVKVLGIFGRLTTDQETYFDELERQYSQKPAGNEYDIFRHLTLTFIENASVQDIRSQLSLLKDLRQFLPLKVRIKGAFVKDEESLPGAEHIAVEFELAETEEIVAFVRNRCGENTVATWYTKVVWFVPKEHQAAVMGQLSTLNELEFADFYLSANKQDDENTLFTSLAFDEDDAN
ncbi:hypothetical protein E6P97_02610 [Patescibacteria group bacterium]|nr:MAG: hypothetical protein E6P97_02610 [Patescibacteria group bacterium]